MARKKPPIDYDDRSVFEKTVSGDLGNLDVVDGVEAGSVASNFIPGGALLGTPLDGLRGRMTSKRERAKLEEELGRKLEEGAAESRILRKKKDELDGRSGAALERSAITGTGGVVGGLAMPILPIVGAIGGQWLTGMAVDRFFGDAAVNGDQDAVELVIKLREMQQKKQEVAPEFVFAALAANLPDKQEKRLLDRLEALAGTRKFSDAVSQEKGEALTRLMKESDVEIRADTNLPFDLHNPDKTASEQYAELINQGQMDARALLFRSDMPSPVDMVAQQPELIGQPAGRMAIVNPEIAGLAASLNEMGVVPAIDNGQLVLLPLPSSNKPTPGKA